MTGTRLQAELEQLKLEKAALQNNVKRLEEKVRDLEVTVLEAEIGAADKVAKSLRDLKKVAADAEMHRKIAEQKSAESQQLKAENDIVTSRMEQLEQDCQECRSRHDQREHDAAEIVQLREQNKKLEERLANVHEVKKGLMVSERGMQLLEQKNKQLKEQIEQLTRKLNEELRVKADFDEKTLKISQLKVECTRLRSERDRLATEVKNLTNERSKADERLNRNLSTIEKKAGEMKQLVRDLMTGADPSLSARRVRFVDDVETKGFVKESGSKTFSGTVRNFDFTSHWFGDVSIGMAFRDTVIVRNHEQKDISLENFVLTWSVDGTSRTAVAVPNKIVLRGNGEVKFYAQKPKGNTEENSYSLDVEPFLEGKTVETSLLDAAGTVTANFILTKKSS